MSDIHTPEHEIAALLAFEHQRQRAMIEADIERLKTLLADDLIHIHSTGMVHDKRQLLAHIARMGGFVAIERDAPRIRLEGNIAILTGNTRNTVRLLESGEQKVREGFSTLVARRGADGWQIILSQLTPHPDTFTAKDMR